VSIKNILIILVTFPLASVAHSQDAELMQIMVDEMNREFEVLGKEDPPAYYMDYMVNETRSASFAASLGSLTNSFPNNQRNAIVTIRVGDYKRDHTHKSDDNMYGYGSSYGGSEYLPLDNNEKAIQFAFWKLTKAGYQSAEKTYKKLDFDNDTIETADFSKEISEIYLEKDNNIVAQVDTQYWEVIVIDVSRIFLSNESIIDASVSVNLSADRHFFIQLKVHN
jgi:hypothetical protein